MYQIKTKICVVIFSVLTSISTMFLIVDDAHACQPNCPAGSPSNTTSSSGSNANITNNSVTNAKPADLSKTVPNVVPPALSNVPETCAISNSIGGSASGFGLSIGSTTIQQGCELRMYARLVAQMGDARAAKYILCNVPEVAAAYNRDKPGTCPKIRHRNQEEAFNPFSR